MNPLEQALQQRIERDGSIGLDDYMQACNDHYYASRDPFGVAGDFTTAPEISQMFGETIGAALTDAWIRAGRPDGAHYVELGPGRGTLAHDALRAMAAGGLLPAVDFVESSPRLRGKQAERVPAANFLDSIEALDPAGGPLLVVANEFFDALPIRQMIGKEERRVVLRAGQLGFDRDGEIIEQSPAREKVALRLAELLKARGGVALIFDYGHGQQEAVGDTLQAVRRHRFAAPLHAPGEQDLTSHVDFAALAAAARDTGTQIAGPVSQGSWLETLGIAARAMALAARNPERTEDIAGARRRLCDEAEMGRLFKVLALAAPGWPMVAGLA